MSKSLAIEKHRIKLATFVAALFYDLSTEKQIRIPTQGEKRERDLRELVRKNKRPVALFVDEAHDLNGNTLIGLKRLMELVEDGGGSLSLILAGHPKLRNDLRRATMEEIGYRTDIFPLDGIAGSQREYLYWLLGACAADGTDVESILTEDAIDLLATKLRTPLQIQLHLTLAFETGYRTGEKPVSATLVESVLSRQLDDLEPTLTRHGYRVKDLGSSSTRNRPRSRRYSATRWNRYGLRPCATKCWPPGCRSEFRQLQLMSAGIRIDCRFGRFQTQVATGNARCLKARLHFGNCADVLNS